MYNTEKTRILNKLDVVLKILSDEEKCSEDCPNIKRKPKDSGCGLDICMSVMNVLLIDVREQIVRVPGLF